MAWASRLPVARIWLIAAWLIAPRRAVAASLGSSIASTAAYAGSKAAMERITSSLAVELGPQGIRVNTVAPGVTRTDLTAIAPQEMLDGMIAQTPLGRMGEPEDIARAVVFLASDDASRITGQVLQSSGGLML